MFCISVPVKSNIGYLAGSLASLRAQEAPCAVALLDASGDAAVPALADASGIAFAWRRHAADAGQAAAIAEGWRQAPGDILGWLNDDDLLLPGALEHVAAVFAAEPDTDVVYGHGVMLDAAGGFTGYFPSIADDPAALRGGNVICQPAAFVRRAAIDRVGGIDTALHYTMDWDLWLRLHEAGARFRFVGEPLAAVHSHATTKTRDGGAARRREIARLMAPRLARREWLRLRLGLALSDARDNGRQAEAMALSALFLLARWGRAPNRRPPPILGLDPVGNRVARACRYAGRRAIRLPAFWSAACRSSGARSAANWPVRTVPGGCGGFPPSRTGRAPCAPKRRPAGCAGTAPSAGSGKCCNAVSCSGKRSGRVSPALLAERLKSTGCALSGVSGYCPMAKKPSRTKGGAGVGRTGTGKTGAAGAGKPVRARPDGQNGKTPAGKADPGGVRGDDAERPGE